MSPVAMIAVRFPRRGWPLIGSAGRAAQRRPFICFVAGLAIFAASALVAAEKTKPRQPKASPAGRTVWHDCKEIGVEGKGWTDTLSFYDRLPAKAQGKAPASVWGLSRLSAGLCVRFTTDAPSIEVRWTLIGGNAGPASHAGYGRERRRLLRQTARADDGSLSATGGRRPRRTPPASRCRPASNIWSTCRSITA